MDNIKSKSKSFTFNLFIYFTYLINFIYLFIFSTFFLSLFTLLTSIFALLTMLKPLTMWITTNCGKFLNNGNSRPPNLPPKKSVCRSRSNS